MAKHIHAEIIKLWADGAAIEYRVKPGPVLSEPYRLYLEQTPGLHARVFVWRDKQYSPVSDKRFVRWLTDWETVEV